MKSLTSPLAALLLLMGGCSLFSGQGGPAAAHVGVPVSAVDVAVVGGAGPEAEAPVRLPDRIMLSASYRLILVDGHLELVRETDSQALEPAPTSMRIVSGEIARGELAYQPALLPQELASEVAANRESAARMDNAVASVMERSRELSQQAQEVQAQSRRLGELIAGAEARLSTLEAASQAVLRPGAQKNPADGAHE